MRDPSAARDEAPASPPTALNARTGEFTPPGITRCARAKSSSDWVMGGIVSEPGRPGEPAPTHLLLLASTAASAAAASSMPAPQVVEVQ